MSNRTRTATRSGPRQDDLHEVAKALEAALGEAGERQARLAAADHRSTSARTMPAQLLKLIDALEEDDDVQTVWGNYEVSDEVMEKLG